MKVRRVVFKTLIFLTGIIFFTGKTLSASAATNSKTRNFYDVVVAGAGTGGTAAAIQAARLGVSVLVVEPSTWVGGQATAAGVSSMDDMSRLKSGLYLEMIKRVLNYYEMRGKSTGTCYWDSRTLAFEPHVGQTALLNMINDAKRKGILDIFFSSSVIAVQKEKNKITGVKIKTRNGERDINCKVLIDATEYGDILPLAGAQYRIGNSISPYVNPEAMIQDITWVAVIRRYQGGAPEYVKPKRPLPGYELARRNYASYVTRDGNNFRYTYPVNIPVNFISHNAYRGMPDSSSPWNYDADRGNWQYITKTQVNWGNDYPGNYGWSNGKRGLPATYLEDKKLRLQVEHDALIKTLHFIYYMQNELDGEWSVATDEYNNRALPEAAYDLPFEWQEVVRYMPPIPYVRESRRVIGKHTLTSQELLENSLSYRDGQTSHEFQDAIAIGGYILDLHGANTDADMEWDLDGRANSAITNRPRGPFQVPLNILIPKDIDGLIAAEKNLSMSRLSAGAIRLQPITMMTGQAAGALAALSAKSNKRPRDIHAIRVQWELLKAGVILSLCNYSDVPPENKLNAAIQISNLYGLMPPKEYPHVPSYNIRDLDDPVLAMAIIKGNDKGKFDTENYLSRSEASELLSNARKVFRVINTGKLLSGDDEKFATRGDFVKAVYENFPLLERAEVAKNARPPFEIPKHKNSSYVERMALLGILDIYAGDKDFKFARPVTRGEAVDIIVRAAVISAGV